MNKNPLKNWLRRFLLISRTTKTIKETSEKLLFFCYFETFYFDDCFLNLINFSRKGQLTNFKNNKIKRTTRKREKNQRRIAHFASFCFK